MLIGVPIMSKLMGMKDTIIVAVGAIAHAAGSVIFAVANRAHLFYVGAVVAALGPVVAPVLRSMTSKLVPVEERDFVFIRIRHLVIAMKKFQQIIRLDEKEAVITLNGTEMSKSIK